MALTIFSTAAEQIAAHARREAPLEACGLLLGGGGLIERAVPADNVAESPETAFEIDPAVLLRCHREARAGGEKVLGWYHSHPSGRETPSAEDAGRAVEEGRVWLIATPSGLRAFRAVEQGRIEGRFDAEDLIVLPPGAAR